MHKGACLERQGRGGYLFAPLTLCLRIAAAHKRLQAALLTRSSCAESFVAPLASWSKSRAASSCPFVGPVVLLDGLGSFRQAGIVPETLEFLRGQANLVSYADHVLSLREIGLV
jgi:hypothetical protein